MLLSAVLIGLFYIFNMYAATVYFGPDKMQTDFLGFNNGDPWSGMANEVLPTLGGLLVDFAILNSSLANANAGANASTRVIFALGRVSLLPRWFAAIHETHRTPMNAVHFQGVLGIGLAVGLGLLFQSQGQALGGPLTTYVWIGYALGLLFAGDVRRGQPRGASASSGGSGAREFNWLKHLVVPILGIVLADPGVPRRPRRADDPAPRHQARSAARRRTTSCPVIVLVWMIVGHRRVLRPALADARGARPDRRRR